MRKLVVDGKIVILTVAGIVVTLPLATFIITNLPLQLPPESKEVPHEDKWGIYVLDLETKKKLKWFTLQQKRFRAYA